MLLPIYYVDVADLNDAGKGAEDEAIALVARMQWEDWRGLRLEDPTSSAYVTKVAQLAKRLAEISASIGRAESELPAAAGEPTEQTAEDGPGIIELVAEAEVAFPKLNQAFEEMTAAMEAIGALADAYGPKLEAASNRGPAAALVVFRKLVVTPVEPHEQLARAIHELRVRRGLTQREVALRVAMRTEQFARYERGDVVNPTLSTITRVARALGVSVAELLRGIRIECEAAGLVTRPLRYGSWRRSSLRATSKSSTGMYFMQGRA